MQRKGWKKTQRDFGQEPGAGVCYESKNGWVSEGKYGPVGKWVVLEGKGGLGIYWGQMGENMGG